MNQRIPSPDCRDGKHGICDGHGWDMDADTAVRCPCACHQVQHVQHAVPAHDHRLVLDVHKGWLCACGHSEPLDYRGPVHAVPLAQGGMVDIADTINSHPLYHRARPCTCGARKTHAPCTCTHLPTDNSDTYCI